MKLYRVVWTEDLVKEIEIEAENAEEAKELVLSGENDEEDVKIQDADYGIVDVQEIEPEDT